MHLARGATFLPHTPTVLPIRPGPAVAMLLALALVLALDGGLLGLAPQAAAWPWMADGVALSW